MILKKLNDSLQGKITLPASKSLSNRALIINALSGNQSIISNLSDANDTVILKDILSKKYSNTENEINCQDAGTVMRFLTAYFAITEGNWILKGTERMHQRPIGILVNELRKLGAEIEYLENEGFPPLKIKGKKLKGGKISIDASVSSQYISALMMIAPYIEGGLEIHLSGKISSQPYISMTGGLMQLFGSELKLQNDIILISEKKYDKCDYNIENDWSAASYWYALAALSKKCNIQLPGLTKNSLQGDAVLADWMLNFGIVSSFSVDGITLSKNNLEIEYFEKDFTDNPDLAPTFIVLCAAKGIEAKFHGLESLAIKESDRTAALALELNKVGIKFYKVNDYWKLIPNANLKNIKETIEFSSHGDHRMAMSLALLSMILPEIKINNPEVVKKSYPGFWEDLKAFTS